MNDEELEVDERDYSPPTKRVKQACDNCRRKKSRCPGEKPRCSICKRLRQRCLYADNVQGRRPDDPDRTQPQMSQQTERFVAIESRLEELSAALIQPEFSTALDANTSESQKLATNAFSSSSVSPPVTSHERQRIDDAFDKGPVLVQTSLSSVASGSPFSTNLDPRLLPDDVRLDGVALYFRHFHNQPYPLLMRMSECPPRSIAELPPPIVVLPLLALSLRTSQHPFLHDRHRRTDLVSSLSQAAWNLLVGAYSRMELDVHYFQGLCLLAQVDFADGRPQRAHAQVALGVRLAQTQGMMASEEFARHTDRTFIENRSTVWTLFMLDRVFIGRTVSSATLPASAYELFLLQGGPQLTSVITDTTPLTLHTSLPDRLGKISSLLSANIEILQIWEQVVATSFQQTTDNSPPFWKDGSALSRNLSSLLDFELKIYPHRYAVVGSPERVRQEPELRPYFLAWAFAQICYSASHCLLHHPFIIFTKARDILDTVPLTYLQRSYHNAVIHSTWVMRLISEMECAGMAIFDPFIGYLAAIAATIQLELAIDKQSRAANLAQKRFKQACRFIKGLSTKWPSMLNLLNVLERLSARTKHRQTISFVKGKYNGAIPSETIRPLMVEKEDYDLLWALFNYPAVSSSEGHDPLVFAETSAASQDSPSTSLFAELDSNTWHISGGFREVRDEPEPPPLGGDLVRPTHLGLQGTVPNQVQDWDAYQGFGDDWSFLGKPWAAYTSGEGWYAPT